MASILPSEVLAWVKPISTDSADRSALAPSAVGVVRDRRIVANPCDGMRLPKRERALIEPLATVRCRGLRCDAG